MATISDVRAISSPAKQWNWEVEIVGLSTGSEERLTFYAQTATIPAESSEAIEIPFKSSRTFHDGRDSSDRNMTITFWDDVNGTVWNYFRDWQELKRSPETGGGVPRDAYVAEVIVKLFQDDEQTEARRVRLTNAFPTTLGEISLDYSANENVTFDVTFQFDEIARS